MHKSKLSAEQKAEIVRDRLLHHRIRRGRWLNIELS